MKHLYTLVFLFFALQAYAQWSSTADDIIPQNHRVWSLKVTPDQSVWAISTFDAFPPLNFYPQVHKSTDEGNSWTSVELPAGYSTYGWDISPIDSNLAFVSLDTAGLYQTIDGGLSWGKVESYPHRVLFVHFFNEQDGLAFGTDGSARVISITTDGGSNWIHMGGIDWVQPEGTTLPSFDGTESIGFTYSINSFYDYHDDAIMIGNSNGTYWISTDKGFNWERKETPLTALGLLVCNIAMKDENTFMVASDTDNNYNGVPAITFTTRDGGTTWIEGSPGMTVAASHYIPDSDSVFVMVGHNDFGTGSEGTAISYDYGENWEVLDNTSLIAIDFIDGQTGYGSCCNNGWPTANGQIHKWDFNVLTSTSELVTKDKITLMPNPVSTNVTIALNDEFQSSELLLTIISEDGRILSTSKVPRSAQIDLSTSVLPFGLYYLKITGEQRSVIKKFVKH